MSRQPEFVLTSSWSVSWSINHLNGVAWFPFPPAGDAFVASPSG